MMEVALKKAGVKKESLPKEHPENKLFLEIDEIPNEIIEKIKNVFEKIKESQMELPFFHITLEAIESKDGTKRTGFIENIKQEGFSINTNGAILVKRSRENGTQVASYEDILEKPELFIDDVYLILKKFIHHGIRTNKLKLGYSNKTIKSENYSRLGKGHPALVILDRTGIPIKRGVDGDEHYVLQRWVSPDKIIGTTSVDLLDLEDKEQLLVKANNVLELIDGYIKNR
ncbi:MAG: hypothetical protein WA055_01820 [Candidatus Moraniibacteriota bacterium]